MERSERYREHVRERVRANVWSAGIAAVLMLFYGYSAVVTTSAGGVFEFSVRACLWTMRIGGLVMAGVAILSVLGVASSLLLDVLASGLIGVVFVAGGIVRLLSGEPMLTPILYVLFGALFLREALRNFAFVRWMRSEGADAENMSWRDEPPVAPERSAASELRARMKAASDEIAEEPVVARPVPIPEAPRPTVEEAPPVAPPPKEAETPRPEPAAESPPEGFLAALAKKNDDEP